ncbi:NADH:ubiquinone oxidoreductase 17 kDa subunit, partial [Haematococcus lacustris]
MSAWAALRRVGLSAARLKRRGGDAAEWPGGSFWSEGTQTGQNGFLFGEVPPKPGEARLRQWWEPVWYTGFGLFFAGCYAICHAKPLEALDIKYWARPRAETELEVDMRMMDKLQSSPELMSRLRAVGKQLKLVDDEAYDLVLMRNEYKVLLGLHDGRVPAELAEIYEELAA